MAEAACPPIDSDLLVDAREPYKSGNIVAASMTARVEVERQLTKLALSYPKFGDGCIGINRTAEWLFNHRIRVGPRGRRRRQPDRSWPTPWKG